MKYPKILVTGATGRTGSDLDKHAGKQYRPTGLVLLSASDMAEILGRVLRRKVRRVDLEVTGRPAEDFETTARRYAARPPAQRDFANWLRTFGDFMRAPPMPGYNPQRLERELRFPMPPAPRLAMANERWKVEHGGNPLSAPSSSGRVFSEPWGQKAYDHAK